MQNPPLLFWYYNIASLAIAIKRRFGKVFCECPITSNNGLSRCCSITIFLSNTQKRQSKNPSSITFFCCRREYKITIDLAAFDRTGPCWQQRYRFTTKRSVKTRNVYNYNLIEENFAPNKEVFDTKRRATWIACLSFTLIAHRTRSKVNNQCGIMCLSSVVSWLQWSAHWW